jgi:hypothetical protein
VQVFARGAASPAFSLGYTSLSFTRPAAANFAFAPPPGAKVKTVTIPAGPGGLPNLPAGAVPARVPAGTSASEIIAVNGAKTAFVPGVKPLPEALVKRIAAAYARQLPASLTKAQRAAAIKQLETSLAAERITSHPPAAWTGSAPLPAGSVAISQAYAVSEPPVSSHAVMGQGWLSVAVLPAAMPAPPTGSAAAPDGSPAQAFVALQAAATPVHGSWGSGRLLRTSLVSVLMTNGHILIGAVQPAVLYADAAQLSK